MSGISHETKVICPHCGATHELSTGILQDPKQKPTEGSISLCIRCHHPSIFTADLQLRKPTVREALESGVLSWQMKPRPGETWIHYFHGPVVIVRSWNERESICEIVNELPGLTAKGRRRAILMNQLMRPSSHVEPG